jgi:hypothetical protein
VRRSAVERFTALTDKTDHCWLWLGGIDPSGYGRFHFEGRMEYAHRWAAVHVGGQTIPQGFDIDHLCRIRHCVNPEHLEPVTRRTNLLRGDTLTAAHYAHRDCGFARCISCRGKRVAAYLPGQDQTMPKVVQVVDAVDAYEEDAAGRVPDFYLEAIERHRADGFEVREIFVLVPQAKILGLFDRVTVEAVTGPVQ